MTRRLNNANQRQKNISKPNSVVPYIALLCTINDDVTWALVENLNNMACFGPMI